MRGYVPMEGCTHTDRENDWETYVPTVNLIRIRFILIVAQILDLNTQMVNFFLAFTHDDLGMQVYMELSEGMNLKGKGENSLHYVLRLSKSSYGLKQGSHKWYCLFGVN